MTKGGEARGPQTSALLRQKIFAGTAFLLAWVMLSVAAPSAPDVALWKRQLVEGDRNTRREAGYRLHQLGPAAAPALSALIAALQDSDDQVFSEAIETIAEIGPGAAEAVPALVQNLSFPAARGGGTSMKQQARFRSIAALGRIGPAALPALLEALKSDEITMRTGAAMALGGWRENAAAAIPALLALLSNLEGEDQQIVATALGQIGAKTLEPLRSALSTPAQNPDRSRQGALCALGELGSLAEPALPEIRAFLSGKMSPSIRLAAVAALAKVSSQFSADAPILAALALEADPQIRHGAINAIASRRGLRVAAVPCLAARLNEASPEARERAAVALGRLGPDAQAALPALFQAARASGGAAAFAEALPRIGPAALPPLLDLLAASPGNAGADAGKDAWIIQTLRAFGAPALPVLVSALQNPAVPTRISAANALAGLGPEASPAASALFEFTAKNQGASKAAGLRALIALHADPARLRTLLQAALGEKDPALRETALFGMASLGGASTLGPANLAELLSAKTPELQLMGAQALGDLGPAAAPALGPLLAHLDEPALQLTILQTLRRMSPAAEIAIPKIRSLAEKATGETRWQALRALSGLGPKAAASLPLYYEALKAADPESREVGISGIAQFEKNDDQALRVLSTALEDQSGRVRRGAALGLVRFGPRAESAAMALLPMLAKDGDRSAALTCLRAIQWKDVSGLLKALAVPNPAVQIFACEALGNIGTAAAAARAPLQSLAEGGPEKVKAAAQKALHQIDRPASGS